MEHYLGEARKEGITEEELSAVQHCVMACNAGRVNVQVKDVEKKQKKITF